MEMGRVRYCCSVCTLPLGKEGGRKPNNYYRKEDTKTAKCRRSWHAQIVQCASLEDCIIGMGQ